MSVVDLSKGRIPPQNVEIEKAVLGALMVYSDCRAEVISLVQNPAVFYKPQYGIIYQTILSMYKEDKPIDMLTVVAELKVKGELEAVGGEAEILDLYAKEQGANHVDYWCRILLQHYIKRELIKLSGDLIDRGLSDDSDIFELLAGYQRTLDLLDSQLHSTSSESWQEILQLIQKDVEAISNREDGELVGISTGLTELDKYNGGWRGGELIILAARPGMGKTAMAVKWLVSALAQGIPCVYFQLEMSSVQFGKRILAVEAENLHANQLYKHGLKKESHWKGFFDVVTKTENYPLHVVPKPGLNVYECTAEARRLKKKYGIGLVVVDYLQLMSGTGNGKSSNREQEISEVSRQLKALSLELDLPVIALSQLSRAVETRGGDKRPRLSDLRESGSIEQDADAVYFLYRPDYYGYDGEFAGECEIIGAKHRNGGTGTVSVGFDSNKVRFCNSEDLPINISDGEPQF